MRVCCSLTRERREHLEPGLLYYDRRQSSTHDGCIALPRYSDCRSTLLFWVMPARYPCPYVHVLGHTIETNGFRLGKRRDYRLPRRINLSLAPSSAFWKLKREGYCMLTFDQTIVICRERKDLLVMVMNPLYVLEGEDPCLIYQQCCD